MTDALDDAAKIQFAFKPVPMVAPKCSQFIRYADAPPYCKMVASDTAQTFILVGALVLILAALNRFLKLAP